jgi:hypothetical protein
MPVLSRSTEGIGEKRGSANGSSRVLPDLADQARIPLAIIKPERVRLNCYDDHDHDPRGLATLVREQLRQISHPSVRGRKTDPPIVYHDDMKYRPTDSQTPMFVCSVSGSMVTLTLSSPEKSSLCEPSRRKVSLIGRQVSLEDANK